MISGSVHIFFRCPSLSWLLPSYRYLTYQLPIVDHSVNSSFSFRYQYPSKLNDDAGTSAYILGRFSFKTELAPGHEGLAVVSAVTAHWTEDTFNYDVSRNARGRISRDRSDEEVGQCRHNTARLSLDSRVGIWGLTLVRLHQQASKPYLEIAAILYLGHPKQLPGFTAINDGL